MSSDAEPYTIELHKHRYATWCAASAYGRGLKRGGNDTAKALIDASGLKAVTSPADIGEDVDAWLFAMMDKIMVKADQMELVGFAFGRAQKLVNIYLKTVLVGGGHHEHPLVKKLHPPLDLQLLNGLDAFLQKNSENAGRVAFENARTVEHRWTHFTAEHYMAHIQAIKLVMGNRPLFMAEEHWCL